MNDPFKIRKNKSQKEMYVYDRSKKSPLLGHYQQASLHKLTPHIYTHKVTHLEPLLRTKVSVTHANSDKAVEFKLDFTQPIPHKSGSMSKNESRNDGLHLVPLDVNLPSKTSQGQKENKATTINQFRCPAIAKAQSHFLKTDKEVSQKVYTQINQGLIKAYTEKENQLQARKKGPNSHKLSKVELLKTNSRKRLAKQLDKYHSQQLGLGHNEDSNQIENTNRCFRKGLMAKIVTQSRNNSKDLDLISEQMESKIENQKEQHEHSQRELDSSSVRSPEVKKTTNIFWSNCSTIKQQEESSSSFMSRQAMEELVSLKKINQPANLIDQKINLDRRVRVENNDRVRKKFPENFFK